MTERIFVDTHVVVYAHDLAQPEKRAVAMEWMSRLWKEQTGRTSIQVLNELYVTLTRKLAHRMPSEEAWDLVEALMSWNPQPLDGAVLLAAREVARRYRIGWWDSLIIAAAQMQECDVLLSEDLQAGMRFERVVVRNPFSPAVQEDHAAYQVTATLSRHRRPGRPKKTPAAPVR